MFPPPPPSVVLSHGLVESQETLVAAAASSSSQIIPHDDIHHLLPSQSLLHILRFSPYAPHQHSLTNTAFSVGERFMINPKPRDGSSSSSSSSDHQAAAAAASSSHRASTNLWPWEEEGPLMSSKRTVIGAEHQIKMNAKNNNNNNNKDTNNNNNYNTNSSNDNYDKSTSNYTINALSVGGVRMKKVIKKRRKVRDPRFCFKTMSEVDVLDDGYKWRKYGQKVVKNTQHPRSYYRCSQDNCRVKKRVERSAEDPRMVITTYEGRHVHSPSRDDGDQAQAASQVSFFW